MIITIDGPAGSGKSTIAAKLADKLGAVYLDTGAMYRAVTLAALEGNLSLDDAAGLADRIEAKSGIFGLPIIGLLVLALNFALGIPAHRRVRAATILLVTGALLAQILLWFAVSSIIGGLL